jgi:hypothetical protein
MADLLDAANPSKFLLALSILEEFGVGTNFQKVIVSKPGCGGTNPRTMVEKSL